ncbi:phage portal protein [Oenococcus sicerae]|uniref:phage portal protein n=1 Tax=Oenococcus sicerae TaxID=2203724 RepID=UPI0039EA423A
MPLFHSNFRIRDSTSTQPIGISQWEDILNLLNADDGKYVSASEALKNPDIQSAVIQLSGDLATAKFKANMPRAQGILDNPSRISNPRTFWVTMFAQMILNGESFAYRWRNANGIDDHWEYLRPSQVQIYELSDGSGLVYNLSFDEPGIGLMENVPASNVIHLRYFSMNAATGISPLLSLANTLNIKKQSDQLTMSALAQSVTSPGIVSETSTQFKDDLSVSRSQAIGKMMNSSKAGPIVLMPGESYTPLEIKSNVANILKQVDWTSTQIAKALQIPDSYLNGQGDQQSNVQQIGGLYANTLNRDMNMVLSELNWQLSADITADIRLAIDPLHNTYATSLLNTKNLEANQVATALKEVGYLPEDVPSATTVAATDPPQKGEDE